MHAFLDLHLRRQASRPLTVRQGARAKGGGGTSQARSSGRLARYQSDESTRFGGRKGEGDGLEQHRHSCSFLYRYLSTRGEDWLPSRAGGLLEWLHLVPQRAAGRWTLLNNLRRARQRSAYKTGVSGEAGSLPTHVICPFPDLDRPVLARRVGRQERHVDSGHLFRRRHALPESFRRPRVKASLVGESEPDQIGCTRVDDRQQLVFETSAPDQGGGKTHPRFHSCGSWAASTRIEAGIGLAPCRSRRRQEGVRGRRTPGGRKECSFSRSSGLRQGMLRPTFMPLMRSAE